MKAIDSPSSSLSSSCTELHRLSYRNVQAELEKDGVRNDTCCVLEILSCIFFNHWLDQMDIYFVCLKKKPKKIMPTLQVLRNNGNFYSNKISLKKFNLYCTLRWSQFFLNRKHRNVTS